MIAAARAATSGEELERLSTEADELLKTTLKQAEKGGVDTTALAAFSLALDQTRRAIAERRVMLEEAGPRGGVKAVDDKTTVRERAASRSSSRVAVREET